MVERTEGYSANGHIGGILQLLYLLHCIQISRQRALTSLFVLLRVELHILSRRELYMHCSCFESLNLSLQLSLLIFNY
jgi:hypothetical protein